MSYPKYILTKDFRLLKFRWLETHKDVAAYGRVEDHSTITWYSTYELISNAHKYLLFIGKAN